MQLERIQKLVEQGVAEGAMCWQPKMDLPVKGCSYPPTLLSNVHPASVVAQQEIFGPVLAAMTFRTPSEAVELGNNTAYGLAASVWSESVNVALHVAAQLKAGVVWVNSTNFLTRPADSAATGKRLGREGGREGLLEYPRAGVVRGAHPCGERNGGLGGSRTKEIKSAEIAAPGDRPHGKALYRRKASASGLGLQHRGAWRGWRAVG